VIGLDRHDLEHAAGHLALHGWAASSLCSKRTGLDVDHLDPHAAVAGPVGVQARRAVPSAEVVVDPHEAALDGRSTSEHDGTAVQGARRSQ